MFLLKLASDATSEPLREELPVSVEESRVTEEQVTEEQVLVDQPVSSTDVADDPLAPSGTDQGINGEPDAEAAMSIEEQAEIDSTEPEPIPDEEEIETPTGEDDEIRDGGQ